MLLYSRPKDWSKRRNAQTYKHTIIQYNTLKNHDFKLYKTVQWAYTNKTQPKKQRHSARKRGRLIQCSWAHVLQMLIKQAPNIINVYDWLIEQGLTAPPTQYRLYGRHSFYRSSNSIKVLKEHKEYKITHKYIKHTYKHKTANPLVYLH